MIKVVCALAGGHGGEPHAGRVVQAGHPRTGAATTPTGIPLSAYLPTLPTYLSTHLCGTCCHPSIRYTVSPSPHFSLLLASQGLVSEALAPSAAAAPLPYPPCAGPPSASASVDSQALMPVSVPHVMEHIERLERKMQVRGDPVIRCVCERHIETS